MARLILASASPRRAGLLRSAGVAFDVVVTDVDETPLLGEAPRVYVRRVARSKAAAIGGAGFDPPLGDGTAVLAADTTVALDGAILGKPAHDAEAAQMLRRLSGRPHQVCTAVALRHGGRVSAFVTTTRVRFRVLTDAEIVRYLATGEALDKAGAYGIQGAGGALVADVRGSYTNVVGLPLAETLALLTREGLM